MIILRVIGENVELKTELAGEDLSVMADSGQMEQVLVNLCTNAETPCLKAEYWQ